MINDVQDFHQIAAMTCMENGIPYSQVDTSAIAQGYRLAFPEKATELDDWLLGEDEFLIHDSFGLLNSGTKIVFLSVKQVFMPEEYLLKKDAKPE